jgi:hypothetical protein
VASVDEGNVVGEADNARNLIVGIHSVLRERLFEVASQQKNYNVDRCEE